MGHFARPAPDFSPRCPTGLSNKSFVCPANRLTVNHLIQKGCSNQPKVNKMASHNLRMPQIMPSLALKIDIRTWHGICLRDNVVKEKIGPSPVFFKSKTPCL
jgi:hypothetical protein